MKQNQNKRPLSTLRLQIFFDEEYDQNGNKSIKNDKSELGKENTNSVVENESINIRTKKVIKFEEKKRNVQEIKSMNQQESITEQTARGLENRDENIMRSDSTPIFYSLKNVSIFNKQSTSNLNDLKQGNDLRSILNAVVVQNQNTEAEKELANHNQVNLNSIVLNNQQNTNGNTIEEELQLEEGINELVKVKKILKFDSSKVQQMDGKQIAVLIKEVEQSINWIDERSKKLKANLHSTKQQIFSLRKRKIECQKQQQEQNNSNLQSAQHKLLLKQMK